MEIRKTIILISRINLSFKLSKYARELKTTKVAKACGFVAPKEHLERLYGHENEASIVFSV